MQMLQPICSLTNIINRDKDLCVWCRQSSYYKKVFAQRDILLEGSIIFLESFKKSHFNLDCFWKVTLFLEDFHKGLL